MGQANGGGSLFLAREMVQKMEEDVWITMVVFVCGDNRRWSGGDRKI